MLITKSQFATDKMWLLPWMAVSGAERVGPCLNNTITGNFDQKRGAAADLSPLFQGSPLAGLFMTSQLPPRRGSVQLHPPHTVTGVPAFLPVCVSTEIF